MAETPFCSRRRFCPYCTRECRRVQALHRFACKAGRLRRCSRRPVGWKAREISLKGNAGSDYDTVTLSFDFESVEDCNAKIETFFGENGPFVGAVLTVDEDEEKDGGFNPVPVIAAAAVVVAAAVIVAVALVLKKRKGNPQK
ncbi:MAG TPA: hypothetical protein H9694_01350 [Firmicutes bacterium]|nr:hypothetical protein [Bacillota bacterium]